MVDSDGGVDDALAIAMAAGSKTVALTGCSAVFGNVNAQQAASNLGQILQGADQDITVSIGAEYALDGSQRTAEHAHGADGLWGASAHFSQYRAPLAMPSAMEALRTYILNCGENDVVLGIGPATNLARTLKDIAPVRTPLPKIVMMSGAYHVPGNITSFAEFNAFADPLALNTVLQSGFRPVLVGLDVCTKVTLHRGDLNVLGITSSARWQSSWRERCQAIWIFIYRLQA